MSFVNLIFAIALFNVGIIAKGYRESVIVFLKPGSDRGELGIYRGPGAPSGPQSFTIDRGTLYILDTENGRIVLLDTTGKWLSEIDISKGEGRSGNDIYIKSDTIFITDIGAREVRGYLAGRRVIELSYREWARVKTRPIPLPRTIHYIGKDLLLGALFYFGIFRREGENLLGPLSYDEIRNGHAEDDTAYYSFERDIFPTIVKRDIWGALLKEWHIEDPADGVIEEVLFVGKDSKENLYFECFYRTNEPLWNSMKALLMIESGADRPTYIVYDIPYREIYLMNTRDMVVAPSSSIFFMDIDTTGVRLIKWWRE